MYAHAALMGGAKIICAYQRAFVTGKAYALISEYALMCDMRLITREYGILLLFMILFLRSLCVTSLTSEQLLVLFLRHLCSLVGNRAMY